MLTKQQVEKVLRESEERYRAVVEQSVEAIYLYDAETKRILEANAAFQDLIGYTDEELLGMTIYDFNVDDRDSVDANVRRSLDERGRLVGERQYRRKDGLTITVEVSTSVVPHDGQMALCSVSRDVTERKELERALKESEERFRSLIQNVSDVVTILEADGTIRYDSPAIERVLGYSPNERIGANGFGYVHPEDIEQVKGTFVESLDNPGVQSPIEFRLRHKDGSWRYIETTRNNLLDNPGVRGVVTTLRDITQRKLAEEALKESEERYRAVVEQSAEAIYLYDADTKRILESNTAFQDLIGYTDEELLGMEIYDFIAHEKENIDTNIQRSLREQRRHIGERRYRRKDGSVIVVDTSASVISYGGKTALCAVSRDVTERRELEEALRKSEANLAQAQRMARLGSWEWDVRTGEVWWSDETYRIYGYEPEELLPTLEKLFELVHPEDRDLVKEKIDDALHRAEPYDFEHRVIRPDGEERVIHRRAETVRDEGGEPLRMIGTVHDITERKRAEEALKESEERYRNQSRELALLHQVRTALAEELDLWSVINTVVEAIASTYGYTLVSAYLLEGEELVLQHQVGYDEVIERIPLAEGVSGRTVRTGEPTLLEDARTDPDFLGAIEGITSEICVPLFDEDEVVGFINVESTGGVRLTQDDLKLMVALGEHVSVAVSRARLHTRVRQSEKRFRALTQNSSDLVTLLGASGTIRYQSHAIEWMLGYSVEELVGENVFDYVHPEDLGRVEVAFSESLKEPTRRPSVEYRFRRKNGSWVWLESVGTNLLSDPEVGGYVVNSRDITERVRTEGALKESEERYRAVVEQSVEAIYLFDPKDKRVLESNKAFQKLVGYSSGELLRMKIYDFVAHDKENVDQNVERHILEERRFAGERRYRKKDGSLFEVAASATLIPYGGEDAVCVVVRDITERKALEDQLRHQAFHDSVTDLPNRALFLELLEHALNRASRTRKYVAVLFVDLDNFKIVNDSLGHEAGNELLRAVADDLKQCVRPGDTIGRIFGDEFAVLLENIEGIEAAIHISERIEEKLHSPFTLDRREVFVTASIGIDMSVAGQSRPEDLLRNADLAMYAAKSEGKSRYQVFSPRMNTRALERMDLENDLRRAIERDELTVYYQPIIALETGEVASLEALARWDSPERGLVCPAEFIGVAEQTGLIVPIGQKVLKMACLQAREWQETIDAEALPAISVNLSTRQFFYHPELITEVLRETGLDPRYLRFEITERAVMDNAEFSIDKIEQMRNLGMRFAIDDFGTGYSCLHYLKRLPVDLLKIDGSFINGLEQNREDVAIVAGTIALGHALGLKVAAEGVETEEQLERLREMGCDLAQGFYFSEPLPATEALDLLVEDRRW